LYFTPSSLRKKNKEKKQKREREGGKERFFLEFNVTNRN